MKKPDKLFQLIKALTKTEKRYFKLHASLQKGSKQYMRLFDAIDEQGEYDEAALMEAFAGERLLRQFNVAKNYLYELLLRSLRTYHAQHGTEARILEMLRTVVVLYEKGLEEQALEIAEKAAHLAEIHEEFALLLRANAWRQRILTPLGISRREVEGYYAEQLRILEQQRELLEQAHLLDLTELQMLLFSEDFSPEEREEVGEQLSPSDEKAHSVKADLLLNWRYGTYYYAQNKLEAALYYTERQRSLLEENPHILHDYPNKYFYILHNQAQTYRLLGNETRFGEIVEEAQRAARTMISAHPWRTRHLQFAIFQSVWWNQLCYFAKSGEYDRALPLAHLIDRELPEYDSLIKPFELTNIRLKLAGTFLAAGDPGHALSLLNALVEDERYNPGTCLEAQVRFITIIAHFESGHLDLIEYLTRSAYRALRSRGELGRFESVMLRRLKRLSTISPDRPEVAMFGRWYQELKEIENRKEGEVPSGYFEYLFWVESKVEECNLANLVHQQYRAATLAPHE